jgi:glycosyltransferase involved in cell wall biosynthesis
VTGVTGVGTVGATGADTGAGVPGIHLFVPMLHRRDAVGEHTRSLRDQLLAAGVPSLIYVEMPDPETVDETRPYREYEDTAVPGDILVYQVATHSDMAGWLGRRAEPLVLNYHSITPPEYFAPWNNGIARLQAVALRELADLAPRATLGIGVSEFDAAELRGVGCPATMVIPVANVGLLPVSPDPASSSALASRASGRGPWWLSVGRLAPNKAHQDTIAALFVARATSAPAAHLTIVGAPAEPHYARALRRFAADLGLSGAVEFVTGIDAGELAARYAAADVLVMLSEHEGFGVPLVEAMGLGLPVVAFDAGAVSEVVGDAGVLLESKAPRSVAFAVDGILGDPVRREALVAAGRARHSALRLEHAGSDLIRALQQVATGVVPSVTATGPPAPVRPAEPVSH